MLKEIVNALKDNSITLGELKEFEKYLTLQTIGAEIADLKEEIKNQETPTKESAEQTNIITTQKSYDVIKNSQLNAKIQAHSKTETVEQFCDASDHVWEQYITNACKEQLDPKVIRNMATGMSFFMIKRVSTLDQNQQANFWASIQNMS